MPHPTVSISRFHFTRRLKVTRATEYVRISSNKFILLLSYNKKKISEARQKGRKYVYINGKSSNYKSLHDYPEANNR